MNMNSTLLDIDLVITESASDDVADAHYKFRICSNPYLLDDRPIECPKTAKRTATKPIRSYRKGLFFCLGQARRVRVSFIEGAI